MNNKRKDLQKVVTIPIKNDFQAVSQKNTYFILEHHSRYDSDCILDPQEFKENVQWKIYQEKSRVVWHRKL